MLEDEEQASNIINLMTYKEGTAGALMGTEMVVVYHNWSLAHAIWEMRKQAEHIKNVYSIYVVEEKDGLLGTISMKTLIFASSSMRTTICELYKQTKVRAVKVNTPAKEVANIMEKYDLVVVPVVNEMNALVGRITIDDIIDIIKDEADKDYQMASGISGTHPSCLKCSKD